MGKKARRESQQTRKVKIVPAGLTLAEIETGDHLIWNWAGGTPCEVKDIDGKQVTIIAKPKNAGAFQATVSPSSLRRDPAHLNLKAPVAVEPTETAEAPAA